VRPNIGRRSTPCATRDSTAPSSRRRRCFRDIAQLAALAAERKLPTICEWREMVSAGCLIGYGPDLDELRVRTADFVVRLFAGGKASEMPFEQPTHFKMGINSKTARGIGIALPLSLLARADEVIE
jgi:ABC-type uncharacterized transport system substrate-binding protein